MTYVYDCVCIDDNFDGVTAEEEDDDGDEGDGGPHRLSLLPAKTHGHTLEMLESKKENRNCGALIILRFFFTLLTHEESHREVWYRDYQPS